MVIAREERRAPVPLSSLERDRGRSMVGAVHGAWIVACGRSPACAGQVAMKRLVKPAWQSRSYAAVTWGGMSWWVANPQSAYTSMR